MVKGIGSYFGNIQSTEGSYIEQFSLLEPILKEYGVSLRGKKISIKNGVLSLSLSPTEKMSLFLKKEEILEKVNKVLHQKTKIIDIK